MKPARPLVVDLDGTLIRSDLLLESIWGSMGRNPIGLFFAIFRIFLGIAQLKSSVAHLFAPNVENLPYNHAVLEVVSEAKAAGRPIILCSASQESIVQAVAAHLDLFDASFGSTKDRNLKGNDKAQLLVELYGVGGFDYIGDSSADRPVWNQAHSGIAIGFGAFRESVTRTQSGRFTYLSNNAPIVPAVLKSLRLHQWSKNLLIMVPMLAGHAVSPRNLVLCILAFIAFGLVASAVYLINDLIDIEADRSHPRKRYRPIPSGQLPIWIATFLPVLLLIAGFTLAALALNHDFTGVMTVYFIITLFYSMILKRVLLLDIFVLATLYTARVFAGGAAVSIQPSHWLLAFSVFIFLALAAVKRQGELVDLVKREPATAPGRAYHANDVSIIASIALASGFMSALVLTLYLNDTQVSGLYARPAALWGLCFVVLFWITRMVMVAHRGRMEDDPIVFAIKDRTSQICVLLCAVAILLAV